MDQPGLRTATPILLTSFNVHHDRLFTPRTITVPLHLVLQLAPNALVIFNPVVFFERDDGGRTEAARHVMGLAGDMEDGSQPPSHVARVQSTNPEADKASAMQEQGTFKPFLLRLQCTLRCDSHGCTLLSVRNCIGHL